jgi:hypothetical protein
MSDSILSKYKSKRVLAVYHGEDAWKKLVPIRWPQPRVRASVRRRFVGFNMSKALLIIFVAPRSGAPKTIGIHYYPNTDNKMARIAKETDDLWITDAPISAMEFEDAPKLLKKLLADGGSD